MGLVDLGAALPTAGGAGILLVIIGVLGRLWLGSESRHTRELGRIHGAHDAELDELRRDVDQWRKYSDELQRRLDEQRELRRHAEDEAATLRRRSGRGDG